MGKKSGLITCKHCGQVIAASAKTCPHCGGKNGKPVYKKVVVLGFSWLFCNRYHGQRCRREIRYDKK